VSIKRYLPNSIKESLHFWFKSDQRALGYFTIGLDALAWIRFHISGKRKLNPISICLGLLNRTDMVINELLPSIAKLYNLNLIHFTIVDCGSENLIKLRKELDRLMPNHYQIIETKQDFHRARVYNQAISMAKHEYFFATDADISLPENLVELVNKYVSNKIAWFPICFNLNKEAKSKQDGNWLNSGYGLFADSKYQFQKVGKYNEQYLSWGGEDKELFLNYYLHRRLVYRNKCNRLFHNYHDSLKPDNYAEKILPRI